MPKYDGTDFLVWKFSIMQIFKSKGIQDVIDGSRVRPEDTIREAYKIFEKDNAKAMFTIGSSLETKFLRPLLTCTSAKEMWDKLIQIYGQKSASNKLILTQRFHEYKMDLTDSVVEHVAKVQNLAQLIDVGQAVDNITIMAKIFGSLPSKYNPLKTAWDNVPEIEQTLDKLIERLIKEESRIVADDDSSNALTVAVVKPDKRIGKFSVSNKFNSGKKNGYRGDQSRSFHTNRGDQSRSHYNNNREDQSKVFHKETREYYHCHKRGYIIRDCHKLKREQKEQKEKEESEKESASTAFVVEQTCKPSVLLSINSEDVWITDSGASRHITYRREWLSDFRPSGEIRLGDNGMCQGEGVGTVIIENYVKGI